MPSGFHARGGARRAPSPPGASARAPRCASGARPSSRRRSSPPQPPGDEAQPHPCHQTREGVQRGEPLAQAGQGGLARVRHAQRRTERRRAGGGARARCGEAVAPAPAHPSRARVARRIRGMGRDGRVPRCSSRRCPAARAPGRARNTGPFTLGGAHFTGRRVGVPADVACLGRQKYRRIFLAENTVLLVKALPERLFPILFSAGVSRRAPASDFSPWVAWKSIQTQTVRSGRQGE